jgi:hypothetical protein
MSGEQTAQQRILDEIKLDEFGARRGRPAVIASSTSSRSSPIIHANQRLRSRGDRHLLSMDHLSWPRGLHQRLRQAGPRHPRHHPRPAATPAADPRRRRLRDDPHRATCPDRGALSARIEALEAQRELAFAVTFDTEASATPSRWRKPSRRRPPHSCTVGRCASATAPAGS